MKDKYFSATKRPPSFLFHWPLWTLSPAIMLPGYEANPSPPSNATVENERSYLFIYAFLPFRDKINLIRCLAELMRQRA
jgi:hypothetical protein